MTDLILEHISKRYGDHVVLEDFFRSVSRRGNVPASWVPQGVEKPRCCRIILGLEQPDHGTIQGQVRPVSRSFQENRLFEDFFRSLQRRCGLPQRGPAGGRPPPTSLGLADSLSLPCPCPQRWNEASGSPLPVLYWPPGPFWSWTNPLYRGWTELHQKRWYWIT